MAEWIRTFAHGGSCWTIAAPPVPPPLRPFVREWQGYVEHAPGPTVRRELPGAALVLILELGAPLCLARLEHDPFASRRDPSFVAGLDEHPTFTRHEGVQEGLQINLTLRGARALFGGGVPDLAHEVVPLSELLPKLRGVEEHLRPKGWPERFAWLTSFLSAQLARAPLAPTAADRAIRLLEDAGGAVRVDALAATLDLSPRRVGQLFRAQVGLSPKRYAELIRFERLTTQLRGPAADWSELALAVGYADQAHLSREVRRYSGLTPTALRRMLAGFGASTE